MGIEEAEKMEQTGAYCGERPSLTDRIKGLVRIDAEVEGLGNWLRENGYPTGSPIQNIRCAITQLQMATEALKKLNAERTDQQQVINHLNAENVELRKNIEALAQEKASIRQALEKERFDRSADKFDPRKGVSEDAEINRCFKLFESALGNLKKQTEELRALTGIRFEAHNERLKAIEKKVHSPVNSDYTSTDEPCNDCSCSSKANCELAGNGEEKQTGVKSTGYDRDLKVEGTIPENCMLVLITPLGPVLLM